MGLGDCRLISSGGGGGGVGIWEVASSPRENKQAELFCNHLVATNPHGADPEGDVLFKILEKAAFSRWLDFSRECQGRLCVSRCFLETMISVRCRTPPQKWPSVSPPYLHQIARVRAAHPRNPQPSRHLVCQALSHQFGRGGGTPKLAQEMVIALRAVSSSRSTARKNPSRTGRVMIQLTVSSGGHCRVVG